MEQIPNNTEQKQNHDKKGGPKIPIPKPPKMSYYWLYALLALLLLGMHFFNWQTPLKEIDYQTFEQSMLKNHEVERLVVVNKELVEVYLKPEALKKEKHKDVAMTAWGSENKGPHYYFPIGSLEFFQQQIENAQKDFAPEEKISYKFEQRRNWTGDFIKFILPILFIVAIWIFIMRRVGGGPGGPAGQIFSIGKSKAMLFEGDGKVNITFKDVAGLDEAKEEVMEVVDFLKNPRKYTSLGGKIPKGVLLVGPPGTGKTLMAKAVAGEAQVPFFSISGSDFVEMFVGVGASRVRDLFKQAREKAPCIIFIDEIDAIGRARGRSILTGNDERENTLNQLLVEMDGFSSEKGVIIMAATNRPDILDSALLRPGRFDRVITIDKPDLKGREQIFKVHLKPIKIADDVTAEKLASMTPGFAGAEIANVCNEAALIAARRNKDKVEMKDFNDAIDRVIGGLEKKNKIISPEEKRVVAYHEAGHAICGWFLEHADPLVKVSIVPRGVAALGYAQYLPKEQYLYSTEQLFDGICMALGGRAAEEIVFGKITTGAQNDLERITRIAYSMVAIYGMNERIGKVSYYDPNAEYSPKKPYSEETARLIDEEVKKLIDRAYERTKKLLAEKREQLEAVAQELLEKEILYQHDLERILGKRPFETLHPQKETPPVGPVTVPASEMPSDTDSEQNGTGTVTGAQPVSDAASIPPQRDA